MSGERRWVKIKNRAYWRYELERKGALRNRRRATPRGSRDGGRLIRDELDHRVHYSVRLLERKHMPGILEL